MDYQIVSKAYAAPVTQNGCTGQGFLKYLPNCNQPFTDINNVPTIISNILTKYVLPLIGVIFTIMIIVGGFRYIASRGNSGETEAAKKTLTAAIIGLLLVILSEVIIGIFITLLGGSIS